MKRGENGARSTAGGKTTLLALIGMAVLLASCGGANSSSGGTSSASKGPITVAVILPFSGANGFIGPDAEKGYDLAAKIINANGGVNGRTVRLTYEDDAADPGDSIAAVSKAVHVDNASAILGPTTITAGAVLPKITQSKVVDIIEGGATTFDHETNPYFFRMTVSDGVMAGAMAAFALSKGWKRAVNVFVQQPAAISVQDPVSAAYKAHGGSVLGNVDMAVAQTSYRSEIEKIYSYHPQVIFSQVDPATAGVLFPEIQSLGLMNVPWVGTNVLDTADFYKAVGPSIATNGSIYAAQSVSVSGVGADTFAKGYQEAYGTTQIANNANNSYDSLMALALAMDKAGSTDSSAVAKALPDVVNSPGTVTADYGQAAQMIKQGKKIQFALSASAGGFNKYHNVFGPFQILQFSSGGQTHPVSETYSAQYLKSFTATG